jgi:hypothetical protein
MKALILTRKDLVPSQFNNVYQYNFPQGSVTFIDMEIALGEVSMYYSWFNIASYLKNNLFSYYFPDGGGMTSEIPVVIPDGKYTITQLNSFLQWTMINNGHYLIDGAGNYVYFIELVFNETSGRVQLVEYPVPADMTGYTKPTNATWTDPTTDRTPQFVVPTWGKLVIGTTIYDIGFGRFIAFEAGTYPSTPQSNIYTTIGMTLVMPKFDMVTNINVLCTLLNNNLAIPCTLLYSMPIGNTQFNENISYKPINYAFTPIKNGIYTTLQIEFQDDANAPIPIRNTDVNITLVIRKKGDLL